MTVFDLAQHQRDRIRRLERDLDAVTRHRDQLERILLLALRVASCEGQECGPLDLLAVLEQLDRELQRPTLTDEYVGKLLRETDPERCRKAAA